jgi:hypothetical protein
MAKEWSANPEVGATLIVSSDGVTKTDEAQAYGIQLNLSKVQAAVGFVFFS